MEKILFIHLSRLGDSVQSLPAITLLKKQKPACEITYLGYEDFCQLLRELPKIDRLIELPESYANILSGNNFQKLNLDDLVANYPLLSEEYDYIINLTFNKASSYLASLIKAKKISGCVLSPQGEIIANGKWAKYLMAASHLQKYNRINLADIYMGMNGLKNEPVFQYFPVNNRDNALSQLDKLGYQQEKTAIGFQIGASNEKRMWPWEYFAKLGENLSRQGMQVLLFGSPNELALAQAFASLTGFPYIDLVGKTSLAELPSYLSFVDVLVSNDTGTMHIAAAIGKKVVGIFTSSAHFSMTGPYGAGHVVLQTELPCSPCTRATSCANPLCRYSIKPEAVELGVKMALGLNYEKPSAKINAGIYISSFAANGTMLYEPVALPVRSFFAHLQKIQNSRAKENQVLWNSWLGLKNDEYRADKADKLTKTVINDMIGTCFFYQEKYLQSLELCRSIIDEFNAKEPSVEKINSFIAKLRQIDAELRISSTPLSLINKIYELNMAEVPVCDFPQLSDYLRAAFSNLLHLADTFSNELKKMLRKQPRH